MKRWIGACFAGLCALLAAPEVRGDDLDHAIGTVVPASDEDLRSLIRYAEKLSGDGATCKKGKDESACVLADCGAGGDAARRLDETLALLQGMEPWVTMARKAALEHYKTLMSESIRKGNRQAELEKYYAYAKFLQDFGKLLLTAADLLDFAKNLQGNRDELAQLLADPGGAPSWKLLAKLDYYDSILGAVQNTADMADGVASQYRENGLGIPDSVQKLSTLKQGASDYKNALRAGAEAYSLVRQAEVWRRYATTLTDAAEKTRILKEAEGFTKQAGEKWSGMRAAIGQLVGKILVAVSEAQLKDMKGEIDEIAAVLQEEEKAIHAAWLDWNRLSRRTDALAAAIEALSAARAGMTICLDGCPAQPVSPPPSPPSFDGPNGTKSWGAALKWYTEQLALAGAALAQSAFAFDAGATAPLDPILTPVNGAGSVAGGAGIGFNYDVDQCTADEGTADAGGGPAPFGGVSNGTITLTGPSEAGPVRVTVRTPGRPDAVVETPVASDGGGPAPPPGEDPCGAIDCDCENLDFGILTREYREECRASEAALKQRCAEIGHIEGTCHTTAQGPNAYPR